MQTRSGKVDRPRTAFRRVRPLLALAAAIGVLALLALAIQGGWHRSGPASAAGSGPEMALDVIAGGTCVGGVCQVGMSSTFTLAVDVVTAPTAGYIGMQTYIDFGVYNPAASEDGAGPNSCSDSIDNGADGADRFDADCVTVDLVYKPAQIVDEIIWPDLDPEGAVRFQQGPGLLGHGGLTEISSSPPPSTFEGNVVAVQMTCPSSPVQATISLLPYNDPIAQTIGSGFVEPGPTIVVPKVGSLTIDCIVPPTPTPTPPPEMALDVIAGGTCVGGVCQVGMSSTFTLAVDVVTAPAAGYIGMQTYIDFGVYNPAASEDGAGPNSCSDSIDNGADGADRFDPDCVTVDLVYKQTAQAADEITWPDLDPEAAVRSERGPGLLNLGGLTNLGPPYPISTFEGNVTSVQMTCPSSLVQVTISLLPYDDPIAQTFGSGFMEPDLTIVVPKVGSLTINCTVLPTPTATPTPTGTATPTPTEPPTPIPVDTDGDGCTDDRENSPDETLGGRRDPLNPWDFYDVPGPGGEPPNGEIDLFTDILGVINHYSLDGSPPYDAAYDRGPTAGPNPWNMTAPDGSIDLFIDILGVIQQHGHDCR